MILQEEDCYRELKDATFTAQNMIETIESVKLLNVVQLIPKKAPIYKVKGLIVESMHNHVSVLHEYFIA